jgi:hypothetical protein
MQRQSAPRTIANPRPATTIEVNQVDRHGGRSGLGGDVAKLAFLKAYRGLVSAGSKTTTLRRWKRPMVRAGQIVNSAGIGRLEIASVDRIEWANLTEGDARDDGFASLAELDRAVRRIYPRIDGDGRSWFKIRFRVFEPERSVKPNRAEPPKARPKRRATRAGHRRVAVLGTMSLREKAKLATAVRQQPMFGVL